MKLQRLSCHQFWLIVALLSILVAATTVSGQTSSFTYQGRLTDGGQAATGNYDLQFALWDSATGGAQIGSTLSVNTVAVSNGVFSVSLDFGAGSFNGANRFLEISARPNGGSFTLLSPRQQVTSTPYAIRSVNASSADNATTAANATQLGGVAANQFVQTSDARLSDLRSPAPGSANYIQNSTSQQAGVNFNISGDGALGGTLSANIVNAVSQYNISGTAVLSASISNGNTFVGTQFGTGGSLNTIVGSQAGKNNTGNNNVIVGAQSGEVNTGTDNIIIGVLAGLVNTSGGENVFIGRSAGQSNTTGGFGVFIGSGAGANTTSPSNNVFVGGDAGIGATTGGFNAFFGTSAGSATTTGQSNTFIGEETGRSNSTGSNNTALGLSAGPSVSNLTQSTAIGANATVSTSHTIVLGTSAEATQIPGSLTVSGASTFSSDLRVNGVLTIPSLGAASSTQASLCRNTSSQLAFCNSSSLRYKKNIATFSGGMDIVNRLRPISFTWKQDGVKDIGFGAEEVEKVAPLFTFRNDKGEIEGVRYDRLGVLFVNAFKEQQQQIETQQEEIKLRRQEALRQQQLIERQQAELARQGRELLALKSLVCRSHRHAGVCR
ncbi:MAG TPA: tail fiber domain-containing protein [Pyrinomonadaceae bacterium]|nr:tail fiber domain-containing protein [Pyrinomonadaceae bacterium]